MILTNCFNKFSRFKMMITFSFLRPVLYFGVFLSIISLSQHLPNISMKISSDKMMSQSSIIDDEIDLHNFNSILTTKNDLTFSINKTVNKESKVLDPDSQCQQVFGPESSICPYMPKCKRLWCSVGSNGVCRTRNMPWANRTPCGRFKWCQEGECILTNSQVVDGSWGPWSSFSECSRSCGGGIQVSIRDCNQPK